MRAITPPWGYCLLTIIAGAVSLGCGSTPQRSAQLEWEQVQTEPQRPNLLDILNLVDKERFQTAARALTEIKVANLSVEERALYAYINARVTYERESERGCRMLADYARKYTRANLRHRRIAVRLASKCLVPPKACETLTTLLEPQLVHFQTSLDQGLLARWAECPHPSLLLDTIIAQRATIEETDEAFRIVLEHILKTQGFQSLVRMRKATADTDWLSARFSGALLKRFSAKLSERQQLKLVKSLPKKHPDRAKWQDSNETVKIMLCMPLSGSFGHVGTRIQTELTTLQSKQKDVIKGELIFTDCDPSAWSQNDYLSALKLHKPRFVISSAPQSIQTKLIAIHEESGAPYHFTLSRIRRPNLGAKRTWTLTPGPEVLVGTLVKDALQILKREQAAPLPLNLVVLSDSNRNRSIHPLLHTYRKNFSNFQRFRIPENCGRSTKAERQSCSQKQTQQWQALAAKIEAINRSDAPIDLIYFDIAPKKIIIALKFMAAERVQYGKSQTSKPLLYANEAALKEPEGTFVSIRKQDTEQIIPAYTNQFTRLSGEYTEHMKFLVHSDPTDPELQAFTAAAQALLEAPLSPNLHQIVEAIGFVDRLVRSSRERFMPISKLGDQGIHYQLLSAGLKLETGVNALPRFIKMVIRGGRFQRY